MKEVRVQLQNPRVQYFWMGCDQWSTDEFHSAFHSPSFRPSAARAGIQTSLAATTGSACRDRLNSSPGLPSARVTIFRGN